MTQRLSEKSSSHKSCDWAIFSDLNSPRSGAIDQTARKAYPSDLTDAQWESPEIVIPLAKPGGRPRAVDMREVLNAMLYLNRTGCQWDVLPHDFPAKSPVYEYFSAWRNDGTWQQMLDVLREGYTSRGRN